MDQTGSPRFNNMKNILHLITTLYALSVWQVFGAETNVFVDDWGLMTNSAQISFRLVRNINELPIGEPSKFSIKTNELSMGEPFKFSIKIRNLTTNEYFYGEHYSAGNSDYSYDVYYKITSPKGRDISPKNSEGGLSGTPFYIAPNCTHEFYDDFINLRRFHQLKNFDEVGVYKIIAIHNLKSEKTNKRFTVISKPLFIKINKAE